MTDAATTFERIQEASFARASDATRRSFPVERAMSGRTLLDFLDRVRTGTLATSRPDGRPHAAPVSFALAGSSIVIASLGDAQRVTNLRARPHVSLVVTEARAAAIIEGTARLMDPAGAPAAMKEPFRDAGGAFPDWAGVLVAITPGRILSTGG